MKMGILCDWQYVTEESDWDFYVYVYTVVNFMVNSV